MLAGFLVDVVRVETALRTLEKVAWLSV